MSRIRVRVADTDHQVPLGTTIAELLGQIAIRDQGVLAAVLNNHVVSLRAAVNGDSVVRPVTAADPEGAAVLRRSISHMLHAVIHDRFTHLELRVGQSLLGGHFYEVRHLEGESVDLKALAAELTSAVDTIASDDIPFEYRQIPVESALDVLCQPAGTKTELLETWPGPHIPVVSLGGFLDIQHGPYAPSTGCARGARVVPYPPGIVLQFPGPSRGANPGDRRSLWNCYRETRDWNRRVGVATVGELNRAILSDRIDDVIRISEALHEKKIAEIADQIATRRGRVRIVFVAGPSSSGKTTFVRRLSVQLRVNGVKPVVVGLDDYYRPRDECPRDEDGEFDFEALEAIDVPLIQEHQRSLLAGEEVAIPHFDFVRHRRAEPADWRRVQLGKNQVLLLEGIHGLNPQLTNAVPEAARFRIFVSALTQLVIDEHNRIFTADARLLRRIVRDRRCRGTVAVDTLQRWPSVRRGEAKHIFPFQEETDALFNSALVYETAILKTFAWRYLLEVPRSHPARAESYRLLKFLELFAPVFPDNVPANSVLREFMGGSGFTL